MNLPCPDQKLAMFWLLRIIFILKGIRHVDIASAGIYTVQDYLQWEGEWELIHGQPVAMTPSPTFGHQQLSAAIFRQLDEALDDCSRCQALFEIDIELSVDTVVRPDVLVICYQPEGERLTRAPSLIFEVISPKTSRRDEVIKFDLLPDRGCCKLRANLSGCKESQGIPAD
jgi:Uma2 family endonuclease